MSGAARPSDDMCVRDERAVAVQWLRAWADSERKRIADDLRANGDAEKPSERWANLVRQYARIATFRDVLHLSQGRVA